MQPRDPVSVVCACQNLMSRQVSLPTTTKVETIDNNYMMRPVERLADASELADERIAFYDEQKKDAEMVQGGPSELALQSEMAQEFDE